MRITHLLFISLLCFAHSGLSYQVVGWHWYNEPVVIKPKQIKPKKSLEFVASKTLLNFRREIKNRLAQAILHPTEANVRAYILLQNELRDHAERFAEVWQKTLLDHPELDFAILNPTENNAQHVLYTEREKKAEKAIRFFAKRDGLLFFYRGNNLLDQTLAPIIKQFSTTNHIALIPVSVDHRKIKSLNQSRFDQGQAKRLHIQYFPALVLVNPKTKAVEPLAYGFITQDELKSRFLALATNFQEGM